MENNEQDPLEAPDPTKDGWRPLNFLVAIFIGSMMLLGTVDVTLRYLFSAPLSWGISVIGMILGLTIFSGLINVCREDEHITVGLLDRFITGRARKVQSIFVYIVSIGALGFIAERLMRVTVHSYGNNTFHENIDFYNWPFSLVFSVLAMIATVYSIRNFIRLLRQDTDAVHRPENPNV
ncbi:MAG: TRAP transporter small permease [Alphaproteobacteria bacterium]